MWLKDLPHSRGPKFRCPAFIKIPGGVAVPQYSEGRGLDAQSKAG